MQPITTLRVLTDPDPSAGLDPDVAYPATVPEMGESPLHTEVCGEIRPMLRRYFAARRSDCYVGSELNVYYRPHPDSRFVVPDLFVSFGVDPATIRKAASYRIWDAGAPPRFVLEVASEETYKKDRDDKPAIYLEVGASEYWRLDPTGGEFFTPMLQGSRRAGGAWEPIPTALDDDGRLRGRSRALGLDLHAEPGRLRFRDPLTGLWLPEYDEACDRAEAAEVAREAEAAARRAAEAELADLRAQLNNRNGDTPQ